MMKTTQMKPLKCALFNWINEMATDEQRQAILRIQIVLKTNAFIKKLLSRPYLLYSKPIKPVLLTN